VVAPSPPGNWNAAINSPGNPNIPSLSDAMNEIFTEDERQRFEHYVRPSVERGGRITRNAVAYLTARKAG
jgi:hypothetical protein